MADPKGNFPAVQAAERVYRACDAATDDLRGFVVTGASFDDLWALCKVDRRDGFETTTTDENLGLAVAIQIAADPSLLVDHVNNFPDVAVIDLRNPDFEVPRFIYGLSCTPVMSRAHGWHRPCPYSEDLLVRMLSDWWRRRTGSRLITELVEGDTGHSSGSSPTWRRRRRWCSGTLKTKRASRPAGHFYAWQQEE